MKDAIVSTFFEEITHMLPDHISYDHDRLRVLLGEVFEQGAKSGERKALQNCQNWALKEFLKLKQNSA